MDPLQTARNGPRRPAQHFRVLTVLLYGRFRWAKRHPDGALAAPSAKFGAQVGLRTAALRVTLLKLKELGYLERLIWADGWFYARPRVPEGLCRSVQPPGDPGAAQNTEVLDV